MYIDNAHTEQSPILGEQKVIGQSNIILNTVPIAPLVLGYT